VIAALAALFVLVGSALMFIAALGVVRMPDVYVRLQASTKAASLGAGCLLVALALQFGDLSVSARAVLAIVFIFLTVPVSGHMIARAAYLVGAPLWSETRWDELRGRYDEATHELASQDGDERAVEPLA
jgi:multicomponent Na+:H+ antiporter subunit G